MLPGHGDEGFLSSVASWSSLGTSLLVGSNIEQDEENQVRAQNDTTRNSSKLLTGALPCIGSPWVVCACKVSVTGKVDDKQVDDELKNLKDGDLFLPWDTNTGGSATVVAVHQDVDCQVEGDGNPGYGGQADQLGITQKSCGAMVISVEES